MKTYDVILSVSELGKRRRSDDSTMTLDDQKDRCLRLIETKNARLGKVHDAESVSGWIAIDSPKYRVAVDRIRSGASDGLVLAYFSRSARNSWAQARFFEELEALGADCWFADRPEVDYRSDEGRFEFGVRSVMEERYLLDKRRQGNDFSQLVILERGVHNKVPYGYTRSALRIESPGSKKRHGPKHDEQLDERALVPDPERAPWVRRIFEWRVDGVSWVEIRDRLEREGAPPPGEKGWTVGTIRSMVKNESYLGWVQYKRREHRRGQRTGEVLRNEKAHEPLVPSTLWRDAQMAESLQRTGSHAAGIAGGLLRCETCGGNLSVAGTAPYLTYGCRNQANHGRCPKPVFVVKRAADDAVEDLVLDALRSRDREPPDDALDGLRAAADRAERELAAFAEMASAVDAAHFRAGYESRRRTRDEARDFLAEAQSATSDRARLPGVEKFREMPVDAKRRVARLLIERVEVSPPIRGLEPQDRLVFFYTRAARDMGVREGSMAEAATGGAGGGSLTAKSA